MDIKNKCYFEKGKNKIYILIVYIFIPLMGAIISYFISRELKNYVSMINVGGINYSNSTYTIQKIFTPFISSLLLILSVFFTIILIKIINVFLNKIDEKFDEKFDVKFAKKIILYVTSLLVLLTAISFFYSSADSFEYWAYGIDISGETEQYIHLQPIPTIKGGNLMSDKFPLLYQIIHYLANLFKNVKEYFDFIIAIAGAVILPLTIKIEKIESK